MRILAINQYYPPDLAPTGRYLHDLARALVTRGHEVHVICSRAFYDGSPSRTAPAEIDGVHVHRLPALGLGRGSTPRRLADYGSFHLLAAIEGLRLPRPDVVLALTTPPYIGLTAGAVARLRGAALAHWIMDVYPDVMHAHGMTRRNGALGGVLRGAMRRQLRLARLALALGPFMAKAVAQYAPDGAPPAWVPLWSEQGLAPWPRETPNPSRERRGWRADEVVFMYSGNMGLGHRFGEFLDAAEHLGASGPRWAFVGGGPRRREIESFAKAHPEARLELLPYAPPEEVRASLTAADVHLVSLSEAWEGLIVPSKIHGIFATGRPAIYVGPRDNEIAQWLEESGGGWIVAEGDVAGLLGAVRQAQDTTERERRGAKALAFAREHFDRTRNCQRIAVLIEEAAR